MKTDLKTFEAFGVFGTTAITVLTAQNTKGVSQVKPLTPEFIKKQIEMVCEDFDLAAIKIGMLYSKEIMEVVLEKISKFEIPIVLDPVYISKAGSALMKPEDGEYLKKIFEHATVVTPNIYEAQELFGYRHGDTDSVRKISDLSTAILIKNEQLTFNETTLSVDQLFYDKRKYIFQTPALETTNLHGTGCSYSSAIAANLALGKNLLEAITISKNFIYNAILYAPSIGHGFGPINHAKGYQCLSN